MGEVLSDLPGETVQFDLDVEGRLLGGGEIRTVDDLVLDSEAEEETAGTLGLRETLLVQDGVGEVAEEVAHLLSLVLSVHQVDQRLGQVTLVLQDVLFVDKAVDGEETVENQPGGVEHHVPEQDSLLSGRVEQQDQVEGGVQDPEQVVSVPLGRNLLLVLCVESPDLVGDHGDHEEVVETEQELGA